MRTKLLIVGNNHGRADRVVHQNLFCPSIEILYNILEMPIRVDLVQDWEVPLLHKTQDIIGDKEEIFKIEV